MAAPTADQQRYWNRLVDGACIITGGPATIAHCHGGSIVERMQEPKAKGKKLQRYNWLVLPLCAAMAIEVCGDDALDADVRAWEAVNGTQASWIDQLAAIYGLDLWALAQDRTKPKRRQPRGFGMKILPRRGFCL